MTEHDCLFCKFASHEIEKEFVLETDSFMVFEDINPKGPTHLLVVPKEHISSLNDLTDAHRDVIADMLLAIQQLATNAGIAEAGYRTIINTGKDGGQEISHLHIHVIGGQPVGPMVSN